MTKHVVVHISHQFNQQEWRVLKLFCDKAKRLTFTQIGSGQSEGIKGHIEYKAEKGIKFNAELPSEQSIVEFLMVFRFFYLEKEPTYFPNILNLIGKHSSDDEVHKTLKVLGKQWNNCLFRNALNISYNNKPLTSKLLLDLWFNAHYFHQDEEKESELKKIIEGFSEDFAKFMLLDASFEASKVLFKIYNGVLGIVEEHFSS